VAIFRSHPLVGEEGQDLLETPPTDLELQNPIGELYGSLRSALH
jgi:hypothetical protein